MKPWLLVFLLNFLAVLFIQTVGAEPSQKTYVLPDIIGLAIERNPVVAGAMAVIDQNTGQRTAAGAYPNPTIKGDGGRGYLKDAGPLTNEIPRSATEYWLGSVSRLNGRPNERLGKVPRRQGWPARLSD